MFSGPDCVVLVQPKAVADRHIFTDRRMELRRALRETLADWLGLDQKSLRIDHDARGRPRVAGLMGKSLGIKDISISYGARGGAIALSSGAHVGVDLQRFTSKRLQNFVQVFRDCGVSPAISAPEAARIWTRMEAAGKRCSLGLDHGMKSLYRQATMASRNGFCFTDWQVFETAEILSLAHPVGLRPRLVYLDLTGAESARPALLGHKAFDPMECPLHA